VREVNGSIPGSVGSKTEKFTTVASLANVYHLRVRTRWSARFQYNVTGMGITLIFGMVLSWAGNLNPA